MSYSVIWSPEALKTFQDRIEYLKINWTEKEITNFKIQVKEYLGVLKEEPFIGRNTGKFKNVHTGLIIKQVSVIYRISVIKQEIELVLFIDNRQDPKKIRKYRA